MVTEFEDTVTVNFGNLGVLIHIDWNLEPFAAFATRVTTPRSNKGPRNVYGHPGPRLSLALFTHRFLMPLSPFEIPLTRDTVLRIRIYCNQVPWSLHGRASTTPVVSLRFLQRF